MESSLSLSLSLMKRTAASRGRLFVSSTLFIIRVETNCVRDRFAHSQRKIQRNAKPTTSAPLLRCTLHIYVHIRMYMRQVRERFSANSDAKSGKQFIPHRGEHAVIVHGIYHVHEKCTHEQIRYYSFLYAYAIDEGEVFTCQICGCKYYIYINLGR